MFAIILCNSALLIGTGNRGGIISYFASIVLFFIVFKKECGPKKIFIIFTLISICLIIASYAMNKYTQYNVLYERLEKTEVEGIVPDTRNVWREAIKNIVEKPIIGHGPYLVKREDIYQVKYWTFHELGRYPHNLYLFLLYTIGIIGFTAYAIWGLNYSVMMVRLKKKADKQNGYLSSLPKLGLVIFIIFLIDQIKVEFLRSTLLDYQHYLSVLFGMFCGVEKIIKNEKEVFINKQSKMILRINR